MMPIMAAGEGVGVQVTLDMIYVSGKDTSCYLDSFDPYMVGAFYPDDEFGDIIRTSVGVGI